VTPKKFEGNDIMDVLADGQTICHSYTELHHVQIFLCAARWRHYRVSNFKSRIFRFSAKVLRGFSEQRAIRMYFSVVIMGNVTHILPVLH